MMMGSSTSCRNDWLNHETPVTVSPRRNAFNACGNEISPMSANRYAAHMVPTLFVIRPASRLVNSPIRAVLGTALASLHGAVWHQFLLGIRAASTDRKLLTRLWLTSSGAATSTPANDYASGS